MITNFMDMLFGCWHTRYSFPITAKPGHRAKAAQATGTYVVCLDCGQEFAYDWNQMKMVANDYVAVESPAAAASFSHKRAA